MSRWARHFLMIVGVSGIWGATMAFGQDPFAANVRPTEPLSPAEEQKSFHLPPGFEIQLFAAEPEIIKPLNMAFDARGRLWLTESQEYPYAAPPDRPARDHVKILEDTDGDGRADKITTFADGLNVPIGLYPYRDGCIVFSIPYVWRLRDTDGDDRCDVREKLFGPMGFDRDVHGLNNAFRRGFDGWLYACHGFNNHTTVAGKDGHQITMQSGNTYRMRLDGSRIEHFTHGQVNPFGQTFDAWGNQFTADCHSKPLTQLLRNACYPSFGKPHDGLGFVSPMMDHSHGSTAIAGVAQYTAENFPKEYRNNLFTGNVMTSRVNRDSLVYHGSTIRAKEEADFLTTNDPWFRPVDVQLGPDGALYVADFYNRIIGHYEVPLDHPGRDRHRGRIWRIVYTGKAPGTNRKAAARPPNLATASTEELIQALANPNLTVRFLATDQLTDRIGEDAIPALKATLNLSENPLMRMHALWGLFRLAALDDTLLSTAAADRDPRVRTHAMKVLAETRAWSEPMIRMARWGLEDQHAFVQRAAADAWGQHPKRSAVSELLDLLSKVPTEDDHLRHVVRMALRNHLQQPDAFAELPKLSPTDEQAIAEIALAINSPEAASCTLNAIARDQVPASKLAASLEHAVRYLPAEDTARLVKVAREKCADDLDLQFRLLDALHAGLLRRGEERNLAVAGWAEDVTSRWLSSLDETAWTWINQPLPTEANAANPWVVQQRVSADGNRHANFLCSLPHGEGLTGTLRSSDFPLPKSVRFYVAGHAGFPNRPVVAKNFVRLRDAQTHNVLKETPPPRNDTAQRVDWDLKAFAGRRGYLELVDGDNQRAYAWLAVGRFEPPVVNVPVLFSPRMIEDRLLAVANLSGQFELTALLPPLTALLERELLSPAVSGALIRAVASLSKQGRLSALAQVAEDPAIPAMLRRELALAAAGHQTEAINTAITAAFRQSPGRLQTRLAESLTADASGRALLLSLMQKGIAPARLLLNVPLKNRLLSGAQSTEEKQNLEQQIAKLTAALPSPNEALGQLVNVRLAGFRKASPNLENGMAVFKKHCAACHQVDGAGTLVGPQLDGIGNRGLERLLEDVLDPNRNVDVAFHTQTLQLEDGTIRVGLVRRDEGAVRVLVDQQGKEFSIRLEDIEQEKKSGLSLMPANVGELVPEAEFFDLMAFLLSRRQMPPEIKHQ